MLKLELKGFSVNDLYDTGSMFDKQDPCLQITIGKTKYVTERQQDAGVNATFPESYETILEDKDYHDGIEIEIEVVSKGMMGGIKHIGIGKFVLKSVVTEILVKNGQEIEFTIQLENTTKKLKKGSVTMTALAKTYVPPKSFKKFVPTFGSHLKLEISKFSAINLFDTGTFLDKQDPCLQIKISQNSFTTVRKQDAGTSATFDETFVAIISGEEYSAGIELELEMVSKNFVGISTMIGVGKVSLIEVMRGISKVSNIEVLLEHKSKKVPAGVVSFLASMNYYIPPKKEEHADFEDGDLDDLEDDEDALHGAVREEKKLEKKSKSTLNVDKYEANMKKTVVDKNKDIIGHRPVLSLVNYELDDGDEEQYVIVSQLKVKKPTFREIEYDAVQKDMQSGVYHGIITYKEHNVSRMRTTRDDTWTEDVFWEKVHKTLQYPDSHELCTLILESESDTQFSLEIKEKVGTITTTFMQPLILNLIEKNPTFKELEEQIYLMNWEKLSRFCRAGKFTKASELYDRGNVDVHRFNGENGWSLLQYAAHNNREKIVTWLIDDLKVEVDGTSYDGFNAMHLACIAGHFEVAVALYERGASLLSETKSSRDTPITLMITNKRTRMLRHFIGPDSVYGKAQMALCGIRNKEIPKDAGMFLDGGIRLPSYSKMLGKIYFDMENGN